MKECIKWQPRWKIEKFLNDEDVRNNKPYQIDNFDGNVLLNEGITAMLTLIIGGAETSFANANAELGVGNSTTAANSTQTDLQGGANVKWNAMDGTYPQVSGQIVTFRSTFSGTEANFAWEEFSVRNGSAANKNLNRKVTSKGTKASGETWILTLTIELS